MDFFYGGGEGFQSQGGRVPKTKKQKNNDFKINSIPTVFLQGLVPLEARKHCFLHGFVHLIILHVFFKVFGPREAPNPVKTQSRLSLS